jgi:hypothetical protein
LAIIQPLGGHKQSWGDGGGGGVWTLPCLSCAWSTEKPNSGGGGRCENGGNTPTIFAFKNIDPTNLINTSLDSDCAISTWLRVAKIFESFWEISMPRFLNSTFAIFWAANYLPTAVHDSSAKTFKISFQNLKKCPTFLDRWTEIATTWRGSHLRISFWSPPPPQGLISEWWVGWRGGEGGWGLDFICGAIFCFVLL